VASENDAVQQIIAYQRLINSGREAPDQSPRVLMLARIRKAGAMAKLLEVTFDLWYPLLSAFNIEFNPAGEEQSAAPGGNRRGRAVLPLLAVAGANLAGANFVEFDLIGLDLSQADLQGTNLAKADLSWANLNRADLTGANLTGAQLFEADLRAANLTGAELADASLTDARYNRETRWPAGFDPAQAGVLLAS
jgi:hypothetical protein